MIVNWSGWSVGGGGSIADDRGWSIFAVDPGTTTGWAWSVVGRKEVGRHGITDTLVQARRDKGGPLLGESRLAWGQVEVHTPDDPVAEADHAQQLFDLMVAMGEMGARRTSGRVPCVTDLIVEDFVLRERTMSRSLLSPVRITAALVTLVHAEHPPVRLHFYSPSSKSVVRDDQLKRWNLYAKGQPHARDALRHLILHLRTIVG